MPVIIKVTQSDIDKLPASIRDNPATMALIHTLVTTYTQLEALLGYDVVLVADPVPEPVAPPAVTQPVTPPVPVTGELIDPPEFTPESVAANVQFEECQMDTATGVFRLRCTVIRGQSGGTWILSSPFLEHFKKVAGTIVYDQDFTYRGGVYHCLGFAADEPKNDHPDIVVPGVIWKPGMPTWPVWEVRAAK